MISIHFRVFLIVTIFMIILTSVSTFDIYQLVRDKNESYEKYMSEIRPAKSYEKKLDIDLFYNTIHNLKSKHIPEPYGPYDYEAYQDGIKKYCESEYVTLEYFRRDRIIKKQKSAIIDLKDCLHNMIRKDDKLKIDMVQALEWSSGEDDKKFSEDLKNLSITISDCLRQNYNFGSNKNRNFVDCLVSLAENTYKDDKNSKNYASKLLERLKTNVLTPKNMVSQFDSCMNSFNDSFSDLNPAKSRGLLSFCIPSSKKKEITLKDVYLLESIIYHYNSEINNIDMSKLLKYYARIYEIKITSEDKQFCRNSIKEMDFVTYTVTKLSYTIIPKLSEHDDIAFYKSRRLKIINELAYIDDGNIEYYVEMKKNTENITEEYFKSLIKRRGMKSENDYTRYVMRMKIRDFLPLPHNIWMKESANSDTSDVKLNTDKELYEDLNTII